MKAPTDIKDSAADFGRFVQLQELFFDSETKLAALQVDADKTLAGVLEAMKRDYVDHKTVRDQAEAELKALALKHPEWKTGETIKTPFGAVEFRHTEKLVVANPERTLGLLDKVVGPAGAAGLRRTLVELDVEALERVDATTLDLLGASWETTESLRVKPAKIDMGKASAPATAGKKGKA
ncbi:MAG: host-nuclease inhibitor Gam family protein [Betaproteobacteria bacterium]